MDSRGTHTPTHTSLTMIAISAPPYYVVVGADNNFFTVVTSEGLETLLVGHIWYGIVEFNVPLDTV